MPKSRYILIVAKSGRDASTYAKRLGLKIHQYRALAKSSQAKSIQVADVHVLPGGRTRRDWHSIVATLRYARDVEIIDVEMPEAPAVDQGDGFGEQLTLEEELDRSYAIDQANQAIEAGADPADVIAELEERLEPAPAADSLDHVVAEEAVAAEPVRVLERTRRSRCKTCGRLVAGPEDPAHDAASHELFG